jgi:hypothetical protein
MAKREFGGANESGTLRATFFGILTHDVMQSLRRVELDDTQTNRRDLVRTIFAATEGYVWEYREHVRSIARHVDSINPIADFALSELTYSVTENGKIEEHVRYISLTAMIRLVTRLAERISPKLKIDFSGSGWSNLKRAIAIRNRVTHPKSKSDLEISRDDIEVSKQGFFWLLDLLMEVMEATNSASRSYLADLTTLIRELASGDVRAWEQYRAALNNLSD